MLGLTGMSMKTYRTGLCFSESFRTFWSHWKSLTSVFVSLEQFWNVGKTQILVLGQRCSTGRLKVKVKEFQDCDRTIEHSLFISSNLAIRTAGRDTDAPLLQIIQLQSGEDYNKT